MLNKLIEYIERKINLSNIGYIEVFSSTYTGRYSFDFVDVYDNSGIFSFRFNWVNLALYFCTDTDFNILYVK